MRIAYFDCFSGTSGDMILGALVDAGADPVELERRLRGLQVPDWQLRLARVTRGGISATDVTVLCPECAPADDRTHEDPSSSSESAHGPLRDREPDRAPGRARGEEHPHRGEAARAPGRESEHRHEPGRGHSARGVPRRTLSDVVEILRASSLTDGVRERSLAAFHRLAEAEAKVHDCSVDEIHFHEVGAIDCIVDIVGAMAALDLLGVEACHASPIPTGSGFVRCAHGVMPVPAPGTAEILRGIPTVTGEVEAELTTPTGAVILATVCDSFGPRPPMSVDAVGYGAGKRDLGARPNLLRVFVGESGQISDAPPDVVKVLEANLDDLSPEIYPHLMDRLFAAGALDVTFSPLVMKKGRPATLVRVICAPEREEDLCGVLFAESSTFGVRISEWERRCLERERREVRTPFGPVRIKVGRLRRGGKIVTAKPEYEDCRALAEAAGRPLKEVHQAALRAAAEAGLAASGGAEPE